jgi:hypothetical protein
LSGHQVGGCNQGAHAIEQRASIAWFHLLHRGAAQLRGKHFAIPLE